VKGNQREKKKRPSYKSVQIE